MKNCQKNDKNFILFIDSGLGGLTILDYFLKEKNNNVNVLYYADVINFPYGTKDEKTIGDILIKIYNNLINDYNIALIVIACNTASVSALNYLRLKVKIPVIGTVPAVKLAAKETKNNKIGIIASDATVKLNYLHNLIRDFAKEKEVFIKPCQKLVDSVENHLDDVEYVRKVIDEELSYFNDKDIDTLVMGCTHYSYLDNYINIYFQQKVKIIDSREGISNRIINLMPEEVKDTNSIKICFISSNNKKVKDLYIKINDNYKIFSLITYKALI